MYRIVNDFVDTLIDIQENAHAWTVTLHILDCRVPHSSVDFLSLVKNRKTQDVENRT